MGLTSQSRWYTSLMKLAVSLLYYIVLVLGKMAVSLLDRLGLLV
jgi:hypothetical protein